MSKIRIQGLTFSLIAILLVSIYFFLPFNDSAFILPILTALILFLGVPHGALDPAFAQKLFSLNSWKAWSIFVFIYLTLAIMVVLIWWWLPIAFMAAFLIFSVMHFSRDLSNTTPKVTRLLYGGSMIVLPTILHLHEIQVLFSLILNEVTGMQIASTLHLLALPWLVAILVCICLEFTNDWLVGLEILAVSLLATIAPPLVAFTIYFCGMHSLRHFLRTKAYTNFSFLKLSLISLAPMLGVTLLAILAWLYLPPSPNYIRLLQFLFVGLAALTVPHMLLIDRIRYQS
ncbi:beta-carotene 15,15'-dioxygenase, Brp/Blh family [Polynucleobacter paneuropaeus]|jgi:Brp/Blh family beta-carotene 15,15'-monooxygenase|nr:beta-carotene 15,15'-dioxygenase, Brp/Blh family [Polynucleobacter paneuropaeus]QWD33222.1 beta-carotene 15,15'-dioxygenase, Brp/Blh family [Polynucleobacter paneuropaeus]